MKHFIFILTLLLSQLSFASYLDEVGGVEPTPTIEGISPAQQLAMVEEMEKEVQNLKQELSEAKEELKSGKLYYNIGNIGSYVTAATGLAAAMFVRIRSTGSYRERLKKTHFLKQSADGTCFADLVTNVFDAKIKKYEKSLQKRGKILRFRKMSEQDIDEAVIRYTADMKVNMTISETELDQMAKEYRKRKTIAWWTFIAGVAGFSGMKVLHSSTLDSNQISEKTKKTLEQELERKEQEIHLMKQTLHQFMQETPAEDKNTTAKEEIPATK